MRKSYRRTTGISDLRKIPIPRVWFRMKLSRPSKRRSGADLFRSARASTRPTRFRRDCEARFDIPKKNVSEAFVRRGNRPRGEDARQARNDLRDPLRTPSRCRFPRRRQTQTRGELPLSVRGAIDLQADRLSNRVDGIRRKRRTRARPSGTRRNALKFRASVLRRVRLEPRPQKEGARSCSAYR